ncbi:MAG TPA: hypothetical protein VH373_20830 [Jatrophihabitantaceae bacterium]|jgi:hypothetical protein
MSTMRDTERTDRFRGRWLVFGTCVAAAAVYLGIGLARHEIGFAIAGPLFMLTYGVGLLLFGRRNEIVGLLAGTGSDERRVAVQMRATAAMGQVLVVVLLGGAIVTLAAGSDLAWTFCWLCAVAGVTFIGATAWFAHRG